MSYVDPTPIINEARSYAAESFQNTENAVSAAQAAFSVFHETELPEPPTIDLPVLDLPGDSSGVVRAIAEDAPSAIDTGVPNFEPIQPVAYAAPEQPEFMEAYSPYILDPSEIPPTPTVRSIAARSAPGLRDGIPPAAPNIDTTLHLPDEPNILQFDPPALIESDFASIQKPSVVLPDFNGLVAPLLPNGPPTGLDGQFIARRRQLLPELQTELETSLAAWTERYCPTFEGTLTRIRSRMDALLDGTATALPDAFEQAAYDRVRGRVMNEYAAAEQQAREEAARRGFGSMPSMVLDAMLGERAQAGAHALSEAALGVYTERTQRELQHLQFVMQQAGVYHGQALANMIQYAQVLLSINQMALDAAKTCVGLLVEAYNLTATHFRLELELFQAQAAYLEIQARYALIQIDIWKAELDAERTKVEINQANVALYEAQIRAELTKVQIYTAQIQALDTVLRAKGLQVDIFRAEVQGFEAQVRADLARVDIFRAALDGDRLQLEQGRLGVDIWRAQLDGQKTEADIRASAQREVLDYNRVLNERYQAALAGARHELDIHQFDVSSMLDQQRFDLEKFKTDIWAEIEPYKARLLAASEQAKIGQLVYETSAKAALQDAKDRNETAIERGRGMIDAAATYGNAAAAALSSQNTLVQTGATLVGQIAA